MSASNMTFPYCGGKGLMAAWIIGHMPRHDLYVEPFCGAANVFFKKRPSKCEILNDANQEIANYFEVLKDRDSASELWRLAKLTAYSRREYDSAWEEKERTPVERACALAVKGHMAMFGSIANKTGFAAVAGPENAFGKNVRKWRKFAENIPAIADRLAMAMIERGDALELIRRHESLETALFYCDPPYVHSTRPKTTTNFGAYEFSDDDHAKLASVLKGVKGMAMVSGYRSAMYDELYSGWRRVDKKSSGHHGSSHVESLWLSPNIPAKPRLF